MFGKLLKYDLKSIGKWYVVLLAITSLIAIFLGNAFKDLFSETSDAYSSGYAAGQDILLLSLIMIFSGLIITIAVSSSVIVIRHFFQNIFSRRGYLTMTLPVSLHQILLSKLITALIVYAVTFLVFLGIIFAFVLPHVDWNQIVETVTLGIKEVYPNTSLIEIGITVILDNIQNILTFYLAMAIGHLSHHHKVLMSFVSYFGILFILFLLGMSTAGFAYSNFQFIIDITISIVFSSLAYFITHFIIKHKLNLE